MAHAFEAVLVGPDAAGRFHAEDLPQKDNLCGCFWASIALRASGFETAGEEPLDQDRVALEAGTVLPEADRDGSVPPGESARVDYRLALPTAWASVPSGTAATGLAAAVERLSGGNLAVIPVAGPWSAESVLGLVDAAREVSPRAFLVANVRTGHLWGTRPDPRALLDYLGGGSPAQPAPEWDVGHFVNVAGTIGSGGRGLLLVRDSYRSLGWEGHHLQPADAFAAALERGDGREGGVLCIAPASESEGLRERLAADGFELRHWDNGTPAAVTPTES